MLPMGKFIYRLMFAGCALSFAGGAFAAQPATGPVGSTNVTVADPVVPRPAGKPCVVQLFSNDSFVDFSEHPFSYTPPTACGKRWSKVVLEADFSVTAGVQFDRTASFWLGGVNLFFGTTEEPSSTLAPSWHVERDLTDYSALFRSAGQGQATLGNIVDSTYTGVISGSAKLLFYPVSITAPPAQVPDSVVPLGSDPIGATTELDTPSSQLTKSVTLPRNVERAYLDVFAQSQNADEFWYTCVPNQFATEVDECGGGNFRETEVSIDGQPAGVAPVYPWIFTGGIDPFLWAPTTGVQTLNFIPYRVDLTPFAGLLSNGAAHTVSVSVAGASNYFSATATLLVYVDANARQTSGQIERNTLATQPATPTITNTLTQDSAGDVSGDITTKLSRQFVIQGYVNTSHGRVDTTVSQTVSFADTQGFTINATTYHQVSDQLTSVEGDSQSRIGPFLSGEFHESLSYPLHVDVNEVVAADNSTTVATTSHQGYTQQTGVKLAGITLYSANLSNTVDSADTIDYDSSGNYAGHTGQQSSQAFAFHDALGGCYNSTVSSVGGVVTAYTSGAGCPGRSNRVFWFTHPDGSPYNGSNVLGW